ncbi:hypothetical protein HYPSUDRAFT_41289 [Hypholoma sublateritium FD-334 SS-4]|uniref:Uncharacterized protein n=1 Tax=Hypholoma sublateritium (strain FD-334 SS-4) TaxID=945553 RepID=A0A0D2L5J7_HYPSF|nr:hypothetical protein HYPSUDRAFT_41289 [Hypholoma sublateritium FD-334 SS-4]
MNDGEATSPTPLVLPVPNAAADVITPAPATGTIDLGAEPGQSIALDALGPMVVNTDGTLSRIANWAQMTPPERERTLRVLSARNRLRLANEETKQRAETAQDATPKSTDARLSILDADAPAS